MISPVTAGSAHPSPSEAQDIATQTVAYGISLCFMHSKSTKFHAFGIIEAVTSKLATDKMHLLQGRVGFEDDSGSLTKSKRVHVVSAMALNLMRSSSEPGKLDWRLLHSYRGSAFSDVCVTERSSRVGAPWRDRYESLQLNTPKDFSHLPYFPFPEEWPMFPSANVVANHLEQYPSVLGLDVRTDTNVTRADYDERERSWTVCMKHADGSEFTLRSSHLVVATGVDVLGGLKPQVPQLTGLADFQGMLLHSESTAVRNTQEWVGKRVVVFGASCSGHDICMAAWRCGATEVTMIQRSPTAVISREELLKLFPDLYTGDLRPPIDIADQFYLSLPNPISKILRSAVMKKLALLDKDLHLHLERKGFQLPTGESDFIERLTIRRGGYYIDQGCCDLISSGSVSPLNRHIHSRELSGFMLQIQVRPSHSIQSILVDGIGFTDGQTAFLIVSR
ncbi:hypothetical protein B0H11DRAFT_2026665 [Mycena galericulata]|nr:hypothetical protein B0H11DRAFT_2026665 [Mycena galericulata]